MLVFHLVVRRIDKRAEDVDNGECTHIEDKVACDSANKVSLCKIAKRASENRNDAECHSSLSDSVLFAEWVNDENTETHRNT